MIWKLLTSLTVLLLLAQVVLTLFSWRTPVLGIDSTSPPGSPRLLPCPGTPNCVCSQEGSPEFSVAPFNITGDSEESFSRLKSLCSNQPGYKLLREDKGYMHFACVTPVLRYVDDLEFLLDKEHGVIQVRSASRVGRSDLGVNRQRVDKIRRLFTAHDTEAKP